MRYNHKKVVNLYVVYEITNLHSINSFPTLTNALFGDVKLTKNADIDKYKYSGYGIRFHGKGFYSIGNETGRNVTIFGVNVDSSTRKRHFHSWKRSNTRIRGAFIIW